MGEFTRDFILDIAMGRVGGYQEQLLLGIRPGQNIAEGSKTIWDHTDSIQFLSAETTLYASSSSASDTAPVIVIVSGLDGDWGQKSTITILTGQTQVSVGGFLIVQNALIVGQGAVGDVYIAESDTLTAGVPDTSSKIQSKILAGQNITHNGWIGIPAGFSAITMAIRGTTDGVNKSSKLSTVIHPLNQPELTTVIYSISEAFPEFTFPLPVATTTFAGGLTVVLPEKTILEYRAEVNTNNTETFFGADFIFIQTEEFF